MSTNVLSLKESQQLIQLFKIREWDIDETNEYSLYNRYKYILLKLGLTTDEKELFLKLSRKFEIVDISEYLNGASKLLVEFIKQYNTYKNDKELYIMPAITKEKNDKDEIKSSTFISYLFTSTNIYYYDELASKSINIIGGYRDLEYKKKKFISNNRPLILVDDFIGSGKQVMDSIDDICKLGINRDNIFILTLYIHETGKQRLDSEGINLIYLNSIHKEISERLKKEEIELLKNIELKIKVKEGYEFGYGKSEALISLVRTPNNTLPIFHTVKKKGVNMAPFPRK